MAEPTVPNFGALADLAFISRTQRIRTREYEHEELTIAYYVKKERVFDAIRTLDSELHAWEREIRARAQEQTARGTV